MKNKNFKVSVTKDGPYMVTGKLPLRKEIVVPDKGNPENGQMAGDTPERMDMPCAAAANPGTSHSATAATPKPGSTMATSRSGNEPIPE